MSARWKRLNLLKLPLHPLLVSLYPVFHLYAHNIVFVAFRDTLRWSAVSLGIAAVLLVGFALILRSWAKAGILASSLVVTFYTFGRVVTAVEGRASKPGSGHAPTLLVSLGAFAFLLSVLILIRAAIPDKLTVYLNVVSFVLISFPLITMLSSTYVQIDSSQFSNESLSEIRSEEEAEAPMRELAQAELPDVYYVILDGYGRADVLNDLYGYDNSSFIAALEDRGFFVASASRSNYLNTAYSLNTSLNLIYFHDFPARMIRTARYNLRTNYLSEFLRDHGYEVVVFDSGSADTNDQYADRFLSPHAAQSQGRLNRFEQLLLATTMGSTLETGRRFVGGSGDTGSLLMSSIQQGLSRRRERVEYAFKHLPDVASVHKPCFVFAHILLPHMPFLYGPGGEDLDYSENPEWYWYDVGLSDHMRLYNYQIDHLNQAILKTIDEILEGSERPLVIVLQSDHGDDKFLDWDNPTTQGVHVRSAIFNAIYYSDGDYGELYPSITPVNTFRLVLNHWFGTDYPLLPDTVLFHEHLLSTSFHQVPEFVDACAGFDVCLPDGPTEH